MKTAREWIEIMESPEREQAIENIKKDCEKWNCNYEEELKEEFSSFSNFLSCNFSYKETEQERDYWVNIEKKYDQCTE